MKIILLLLLAAATLLRLWAAANLPVRTDEAYLWMLSQKLDTAFFDAASGSPALIAWLTDLLGNTPLALRIVTPFMAALASLMAYLFLRRFTNAAAAAAAVSLLNITPLFNSFAIYAQPEMPALAFVFAALWMGCSGKNLTPSLFGAGISLGIAALFLPLVVFIWPALLVCAAKSHNAPWYRVASSPGTSLGAIAALCGWIPSMLWNQANEWLWLKRTTFRGWLGDLPSDWISGIRQMFDGLTPVGIILLFAALGLLIATAAKNRRARLSAFMAIALLLTALLMAADQNVFALCILVLAPLAWALVMDPWKEKVIPSVACALLIAGFGFFSLHAGIKQDVLETNFTRQALTILEQHPDKFYIARSPDVAALLAWELRGRSDSPWPPVFVRESQNMDSQFSLWPRYDAFVETEKAPDEFFEELQAVNPYLNRDAIYIGNEPPDDLPQTISGAFEQVTPLIMLRREGNADSPETFHIYLCERYQTMPL